MGDHLDIFSEHPLFGTTVGDIRDVRKKAYTAKGYNDLAALTIMPITSTSKYWLPMA